MQDSNSSDIDKRPQGTQETFAAIAKEEVDKVDTQTPSSQGLVSRRKSNRKPISLGLSLFLSIGLVAFSMLGFSVFIQIVQAVQQKILDPIVPSPIPSPIPTQQEQPITEPSEGSVLLPTPIEPATEAEPDGSSSVSEGGASNVETVETEAQIIENSAPASSSESNVVPQINEEVLITPANSQPTADSIDEAQSN